ncbi:BgTH12-07505 [Blumeria graminis f. sp. triticale]|uniref:BgtAcSP-31356 n=3 Tax=Blumeria graminis TaxID=34373 RepID=A0A9X9LAP8_BLUGR|nr:hypothetical protein BGT96224_AcSP31356 [Blumeria graminis f. sp. tritici 96224]CAD6500327.1 BgTH12-07505 [Blumeria graminis f. sp. triticale]VCU40582.1 BgtAcSP-31356 [Blumeria graminis f. sp. tritici]
MRTIINLTAITFGLLHQILFTIATLTDFATQSAVSGYICDDQIIWRQKVQEVVNHAKILVENSKTYMKFPSLFEDTKLFNVGYQNLYVVPIRNFESLGRGGSSGMDRIVIDKFGNFISVVALLKREIDPSPPTYAKCIPFQTYSNYNQELHTEKTIKMAGYACGANFIGDTVQESMKRQCNRFVDIFVRSRDLSKISNKKRVVFSKNKVSFTHNIRRDYDSQNLKNLVKYRVEFTWQCSLIQLSRLVEKDSSEKPCRTLYTTSALPGTMTNEPSLNEHGKSMEYDKEEYACNDYSFRIETIQNYILEYLGLESNTWGPINENFVVRVSPDLTLFNMRLSERQSAARSMHPQFALGFDVENRFTGLYYASVKSNSRGIYKVCDDFKYLEQRLQYWWTQKRSL